MAGGADDEERVALAYVDGGDFQLTAVEDGCGGPEGESGGQREGCEGGERPARGICGRPSSRRRSTRRRAERGQGWGPGTRRSADGFRLTKAMACVIAWSRSAVAALGMAASIRMEQRSAECGNAERC